MKSILLSFLLLAFSLAAFAQKDKDSSSSVSTNPFGGAIQLENDGLRMFGGVLGIYDSPSSVSPRFEFYNDGSLSFWNYDFTDQNALKTDIDGNFHILSNGGATSLFINDSDLKVGIGTISPNSRLHIRHNSDNGGSNGATLNLEETEAADGSRLRFTNSNTSYWNLYGYNDATAANSAFNRKNSSKLCLGVRKGLSLIDERTYP